MNPLRIGCVKYINARPLIRGWPGDVAFDHPSVLCQRLAKGELDVALVSSFEHLRNPIYRIVDDVSISSDGPVYSVVLAYRGDVSEIEEIALDPASQTSANLLRSLIAEHALTPRLSRNIGFQFAKGRIRPACGPVRPAGLQPASAAVQPAESKAAENISAGGTGNMSVSQAPHRAQLLIGDQAIHFRQKRAAEFQFWDLGEQWKKLTGLPFVYALWLVHPEVSDAKSIAQRLRKLRDKNLANLDAVIAETVAGVGDPDSPKVTREFIGRYFRKHLRFSFGKKEKQGLRCFADLCVKHGALPVRDRPFTVV